MYRYEGTGYESGSTLSLANGEYGKLYACGAVYNSADFNEDLTVVKLDTGPTPSQLVPAASSAGLIILVCLMGSLLALAARKR